MEETVNDFGHDLGNKTQPLHWPLAPIEVRERGVEKLGGNGLDKQKTNRGIAVFVLYALSPRYPPFCLRTAIHPLESRPVPIAYFLYLEAFKDLRDNS